MTKRFRQISQLYFEAVAHDVGARAAFLDEACRDPDVRREVESLLEQATSADRFFETSAMTMAAEVVGDDALAPGASLGKYQIERALGRGGRAPSS